ncbi:MAG: AAA family ATPase [Candidatus Lokiarchaeota archaeon]|nr:AAA family ATPase [Candidatus Lokiarchaeota archaeon]
MIGRQDQTADKGSKIISTILHFFRNISLKHIIFLYLIFPVIFFPLMKYRIIAPGSSLGEFLWHWKVLFYPSQSMLLKFKSVAQSGFLVYPGDIPNLALINLGYFTMSWLANLLVFCLIGIIDYFAQKLFLSISQFVTLCKKILSFIVVFAIASLSVGTLILLINKNAIFPITKIKIIISFFIILYAIATVKKVYKLDIIKAIFLFLLVVPFIPFSIILLLIYSIYQIFGSAKRQAVAERTIKTWLENIYAPSQSMIRMKSDYSPNIIFFLTSILGIFGIYLIYLFPKIHQFDQLYQQWVIGFLGLFHKSELLAIFIRDDFSMNLFSNVSFETTEYLYLFILYVMSFFIIAAFIDFTAWMVLKFNKSYRLVYTYIISIHSSSMLLYAGISILFLIATYYFKLLFDIQHSQIIQGALLLSAIMLSVIIFTRLNIHYVHAFRHSYSTDTPAGFILWLLSLFLFPLGILCVFINSVIEIISPVLVPWRTKKLTHNINELSAITETTPGEIINPRIDTFTKNLENRFNYNIEARQKVDITPALTTILRYQPRAILSRLLRMADGSDPDLSQDARKWLGQIFNISAESHIRLFYIMLEQRPRIGSLEQMVENIHKDNEWHEILTNYIQLYYAFDQRKAYEIYLTKLSKLYKKLDHDPLAHEFSLIYKNLSILASAHGLSEITRSDEPITEYLAITDPQEAKLHTIFRLFLRLNNYQDLFERLENENKIPFVSMQMVILVEIQRELETLQGKDLEKNIIKDIVSRFQNWVMLQNDQLRGSIELIVDLKTQMVTTREESSIIVVEIYNAGTALAQNVKIMLTRPVDDSYKITGENTRYLPMIEPKAKRLLEFSITPLKGGAQRLLFKIEYLDLDRNKLDFEYADIIQFIEKDTKDHKKYEIGDLINPYIAGSAVAEPRMFFGRREEFEKIRNNLEGQFKDNIIVLHGQRRTGKSSMLIQMQNHLDLKEYLCVYINLESLITPGLQNFLFRISTLIVRELERKGIRTYRPEFDDFSKDPSVYFTDTFLSNIYKKINNRKLLLMLDEFEQLERRVNDGKLDRDIFPFLRDLMQYQDQLSFILAGAHKLNEMRSDYWNVLFNITQYVKLGYLDKESSYKLIQEPVKEYIRYDPLTVEKIYRMTAGQPYFIQLICHGLFNKYRRDKKNYITINDVNIALQETVLAGSGQLDYIWNTASWHEKIAMATISDLSRNENERIRLNLIGARLKELHFSMEDKNLREALNHLIDLEIISGDAHFDSFMFKIDLVRYWLKETHPIGKAIEEYQHSLIQKS